jgi:hypothetical protein
MANSLGVAIASDQSAFPATSLNSGAITNPTSVLTRSANVTSSGVNVSTSASPYFTWTSANPPVNGQGIYLIGSPVPGAFVQFTTYWVVGVSGSTFNLSATLGGAAIVPTSTGTAVTATLEYKPNDLIANAAAAGSIVVPSFALATSAGGAIIPRLRLQTGVTGTRWANAILSINLWSTQPTYTNGDAQLYAVATGSAGWLANFMVTLTQFGDGAAGFGQLTGANQMALRLASGTAVFWDLQILSFMQPNPSQTFTLTAECLN